MSAGSPEADRQAITTGRQGRRPAAQPAETVIVMGLGSGVEWLR